MDNIRHATLIEYLFINNSNVLCIGPTGSGKTMTISSKLSRNMPKKFICDFIIFSARTTANQTQVKKHFLFKRLYVDIIIIISKLYTFARI